MSGVAVSVLRVITKAALPNTPAGLQASASEWFRWLCFGTAPSAALCSCICYMPLRVSTTRVVLRHSSQCTLLVVSLLAGILSSATHVILASMLAALLHAVVALFRLLCFFAMQISILLSQRLSVLQASCCMLSSCQNYLLYVIIASEAKSTHRRAQE